MPCENRDLNLGQYGKSRETIIADVPTIQTGSAVAAGESIHDSYITFECVAFEKGLTGTLREAGFFEDANSSATQKPSLTLYLFHTAPTEQTKGAALTLSSTDFLNMVCDPLDITATTKTCGATDQSLTAERFNPSVDYQCADTDNSLYGILVVTSGTPTFVASTEITPYIKVIRD